MKNKALIVAVSEFTTLTRSKAFLVGLALMPVIMAIGFGVQKFTRENVDTKDRRFVVVDRSGVLYPAIAAAAEQSNQSAIDGGTRKAPRYLPTEQSFAPDDQAARSALSDRVRKEELYAFVEIPTDIVDPGSNASLTYYSNHPADQSLPGWIGSVVNREVLNIRFRNAAVDRGLVARLTKRVDVSELGLLERDQAGGIKAASRVDKIRTFVIPVGMMLILLFSVMSGSPQLLNSVMEEKMSRISEVLIGSVTPFELMMGKLLGSAAVSFLLALIYVVAGVFVARHYGYGDAIHARDLAWFALFLAVSVMMFGSMFISIGAACTDLKDAQGMMGPAMMFLMLPWMTWFAVLNAPESPMAVGLSLFPSATPFLMLLRIMLPPGPPVWQVVLGVALTIATAIGFTYAAGKIFRTGLLMQGKAATLGEMWRWVRAG
ncbi:MAG TPA: ABC transporter permease [Vicinamibacterales bacterium]|jgi:ABC-2 type transport system permease protein|nr:ABC transporter permease [Vicinamibacterales bacterium]